MTVPFPTSLCHRCTAHRLIVGRTSSFVLCTALPEKYPRQPVLACPAFTPASEGTNPPVRSGPEGTAPD